MLGSGSCISKELWIRILRFRVPQSPAYCMSPARLELPTTTLKNANPGMFIPDPDFYPSRIPIQNSNKREG